MRKLKPTAIPSAPALVRSALVRRGAAALAVGFGLSGAACGGEVLAPTPTPNPPQPPAPSPLPCQEPQCEPPLPPPLPDGSFEDADGNTEDFDAAEDFSDMDTGLFDGAIDTGVLVDATLNDVVIPLPPPPLPPPPMPAPLPPPPKPPPK